MAVKNKEKKQQPVVIALDADKQKEFTHKVKKLKEKYGGDLKRDRGVVFVGHIPHGFYETEMRSFFSQFGKVTRVRLSRSKKTGSSKGYAYVEFDDVDVAEIAAETMNNYLMFERLLKCELLSSDKLHPALFHGSHRGFSKPKASSLSIDRHNSVKKDAKLTEYQTKKERIHKKKLAKLAKLGVDLDINGILVKGKKIKSTKPNKRTVETPDLKILVEDETEKEISFKTPPNSIRSSKLTGSGKRKKSADDTPRTTKTGDKISTPKTIVKSSKKVKQEEKLDSPKSTNLTPSSAERPKRMTTRSAAKKLTLGSKNKLKTPPLSGRKKK